MKTWEEIKEQSKRGDWERVAEIAGCSRRNLELMSRGERPDNFNAQQIFSDYLEARHQVTERHRKGNQDNAMLLAHQNYTNILKNTNPTNKEMQQLIAYRVTVCQTCEHFKNSICKRSGYMIELKVKTLSFRCPLAKW